MTAESAPQPPAETPITVHYWASARAATGVNEDRLDVDGPITLGEVCRRVLALHPEADNLEKVIAVCSVLLDDEPVGRLDPEEVRVHPGRSVEFLPPFAGG